MWLTIWVALSSMKRIEFAFTPVVYSNVDYAFYACITPVVSEYILVTLQCLKL